MSQSDYPDIWTCGPDGKVKVEVRTLSQEATDDLDLEPTRFPTEEELDAVAEQYGATYEWIEIPTTGVETYVQKGEYVAMNRASKVTFPTTWGKNSGDVKHNAPIRLINSFDPNGDNSTFSFARVSYWSEAEEDWVLTHLGWCGGVGQSSTEGVSKMWVYDVAELLPAIGVTEAFNNPSVEKVLTFIAQTANTNTPIPLTDVVISPPETWRAFETNVAESALEPSFPAIFNPYSDSGGQTPLVQVTEEEALSGEAQPSNVNYEAITIDTNTALFDTFDYDSSKTFQRNRDTLADVTTWFQTKANANVSFQPTPSGEGLILFCDFSPSSRVFAASSVVRSVADELEAAEGDVSNIARVFDIEDPSDLTDYGYFHTVDIIKNNALYEMMPQNSLTLRGELGKGATDAIEVGSGTAVDEAIVQTIDYGLQQSGQVSKTYPEVVVEVPPLIQAAGGTRLSGTSVESDATTLDEARSEAISTMKKRMRGSMSGDIEMFGTPRLLPYDRIDAFEVCDGLVEYQPSAVSYEVESVKHTKMSDGRYTTRAQVNLYVDENEIDVVSAKMVSL